MNWNDLTMAQKNELMQIYIRNGVTSLDNMRGHFNSFANGGPKKTYKEWATQMHTKYPWLELDSNKAGYDYERYFNENYDDAIARLTEKEARHFTDKYKLANHPTFSTESRYSQGPSIGGSWTKDDKFIPSVINVQQYPTVYDQNRAYTEEEIYDKLKHRFDEGGPKGTVLPVNSQGIPYYTLPDVVVSDTALPYARYNSDNNNLYRYYNAIRTGQIGLNQIQDEELRNRVRGYKGEEYVRNGMKTAAKIATATAVLPTAISLAPEALGLLSNPVVNTALTVDGFVNAPKNIKEGINAIKEGDYTEGGIDLGLTALDIAGAGMLHKSFAPFRKRLAETILRQGDKIRTLDFYPGIKDKAKYLFLGNKYPEAAYKTGYYSGEKMLPKENMSHEGDVIDGFLGKEYNVQGEDLSKASKKAQEYIQKNYRRKAKDVKVYDLGNINNEFRGELMSEADANAYLNKVRKFRNEDSGIRKGEKFVLDPQGYNITGARREGNNLIIDKEDIWKYNPKDYTKRYENTSFLERLGLRFLDSQGTPMVHKWTEIVPIITK